jgi:transcriptional regulator with XRE-family HTH domain
MEQEPLNPTRLVGAQVAKVRKSRGMTQDGLADAMREVGIDFERVVVAKLEKGLRPFVKLDELLALCVVLEISLVDLLVPSDVGDNQRYLVTPKATTWAANARDFIRGEDLLFTHEYPGPPVDPESPFASWSPGTLLDPIRWMPKDRADRVLRHFIDREEGDQS